MPRRYFPQKTNDLETGCCRQEPVVKLRRGACNASQVLALFKEAATERHKPLSLLEVSHMSRFLECGPSNSRDRAEPRLNATVCNLIVSPVDEQSRNRDVMAEFPALPVLEVTNNGKLRWSLPCGQINTFIQNS